MAWTFGRDTGGELAIRAMRVGTDRRGVPDGAAEGTSGASEDDTDGHDEPRPKGRNGQQAGHRAAAVLLAVGAAAVTTATVVALVGNAGPEPEMAPPPPVADDAESPTLAPGPTTAALVSSTEPTTVSGAVPEPPNDLGLSRPITRPECRGMVVVVGTATDPAVYPQAVRALLGRYPGSEYLSLANACRSLRVQLAPTGYTVYFGPFTTPEQACRAYLSVGPGSPVVVLDDAARPPVTVHC